MNKIEVKAFKFRYCEDLLEKALIDSSQYENPDYFKFDNEFAEGKTCIFFNENLIDSLDLRLGYNEKGVNECDVNNAILLYQNIFYELDGIKRPITPFEASDKRLWTYLAHSYFYKYMQKRWQTGDIKKRYFMPGKRHQLRFEYLVRHGVARLWWMAYLCEDKINQKNPFHLLPILLNSTDVALQILERKWSHNRKLLHSHLKVIEGNVKYQKAEVHRDTVKRILANTGTSELTMLTQKELMYEITNLAETSLK
ncbi:DUF6339 family protein [Salinimicrobium sediminilitoris]|uniref:DUF6339 family protein n=1 Tax=Salinimicrobium sediminilitoris TaxID=2876715 RepID=UPI001E2DFDDA|nr:DUF6339 family protein [Salinimicrobium sediminilitoris]MCC8361020.1 hypothetical protein [Salinimicrobium sediminilitoris]